MWTPSSLNVVTVSTTAPLSVSCSGWSFTMEPISISFVFHWLKFMPLSVDCWTRSSTNDCMWLLAAFLMVSVMVVSLMYLCVRQPGRRPSVNVSSPRYDPWGIPAPTDIQCLVDLDPLMLIDQECAHQADNDVWQIELSQLGCRYLVVSVLKSLGKINKDCSDRLAGVDNMVPVM